MQRFSFILVPGAGGSAWYWHRVVPELANRGHEAVAVDLPAADDSAGLAEYARCVLGAIGDRDPAQVIVVAQSLGGFVAPMVCEQRRVRLLVLVNAMVPRPGETPGEWWVHTGHGEARRRQNLRDGRSADAPFDARVDFFHDVPPRVVEEAWSQGEPRQSDAVFDSRCAFKEWPAVATRILVGRDDRFLPAELQRRVARDRLGMDVDEMAGGHLVALSQPEELSSRLVASATAPATLTARGTAPPSSPSRTPPAP
jgi:pimeloyl-ACP methyl ester carboxylesterase